MRIICIYGKGGIGKSTIACNLSVCLANYGLKVMQIGCDPKADSTFNILGHWVPSILSKLEEYDFSVDHLAPEDNIIEQKHGVYCMEVGGPPSGRGCAGRGIIRAINSVDQIIDDIRPDVLILDVLGDIICGGLILPMWKLGLNGDSRANEIYIVADGDFMTIYAANRLVEAIHWINTEYRDKVALGGIICNAVKGNPESLVTFSEQVGTEIVGIIPHTKEFIECGMKGVPVLIENPNGPVARILNQIANQLWFRPTTGIPKPLDENGLKKIRDQILADVILPRQEVAC